MRLSSLFLCFFKQVSFEFFEFWMLNIESMKHKSFFEVLLYLTCRPSQRQFLLAALKTKQCMNNTFLFLCRSHNFLLKLDTLSIMIYLHQQCVMISISLLVNKGWILSNIYFIVRHIVDKLSFFKIFAFFWQIIVWAFFFICLLFICISSSMNCLFILLSFVHFCLWVVCLVYIPHCNWSDQWRIRTTIPSPNFQSWNFSPRANS